MRVPATSRASGPRAWRTSTPGTPRPHLLYPHTPSTRLGPPCDTVTAGLPGHASQGARGLGRGGDAAMGEVGAGRGGRMRGVGARTGVGTGIRTGRGLGRGLRAGRGRRRGGALGLGRGGAGRWGSDRAGAWRMRWLGPDGAGRGVGASGARPRLDQTPRRRERSRSPAGTGRAPRAWGRTTQPLWRAVVAGVGARA